MYKKMSYGSSGSGNSRMPRGRPPTSKKTIPESKAKEKKVGRNNPPKKSNNRGGLKRLTEKQLMRLKEHSKMHGGMGSKHMKKMMMVMTKEGKSFSEAHKIAVKHDKKK